MFYTVIRFRGYFLKHFFWNKKKEDCLISFYASKICHYHHFEMMLNIPSLFISNIECHRIRLCKIAKRFLLWKVFCMKQQEKEVWWSSLNKVDRALCFHCRNRIPFFLNWIEKVLRHIIYADKINLKVILLPMERKWQPDYFFPINSILLKVDKQTNGLIKMYHHAFSKIYRCSYNLSRQKILRVLFIHSNFIVTSEVFNIHMFNFLMSLISTQTGINVLFHIGVWL